MTAIRYADDLQTGQQIQLGSYTITESEIIAYAQQWDPVFIHADPTAAAKTPLGGVIASGLHTLAIYQRLAVPAFWSHFTGGVGRSFEIYFRRPVHPGATLTGQLTVHSVIPRVERGDAKVAITAELTNDHGETVLELTNHSALPLRSAAAGPS
ncbi:MaoC/PaaZ C-terminal domain-containing protein [Dietzia sp. PP-33]|uniref:MaoC/PaaZ C-terminal domain-containing protein n=1 Tax=Dietzia sp. PP-33 TaxID=2957500 RepID=UPI0029B6E8BD|nr:MaoC/PaaZ C-terminal domain-containing protein [Dietzia sp. PP-33]MDX2358409.1 dehydratase [Dietzia sp. PP-33]